MADVKRLKRQFEEAKQALLDHLFTGEPRDAVAVQSILDRMSRIFNQILLSTLEDIGPVSSPDQPPPAREFMCAFAINRMEGWAESCWQVVLVNGEPVHNASGSLSVREFTRQRLLEGWKVATPQMCGVTVGSHTPDGQPIYELYFYRDRPNDRLSLRDTAQASWSDRANLCDSTS
jgi:hypothetical protein